MGTPDFAVESLRCLVDGGYNIVGVVTMPDKPIGRHGSVLQASAVKQYAVEHDIKVLQPEKLKDPSFVDELRGLHADLQIVVAFRMLPEVVWSMPPLGTFNLHASLLPQYRGAAPINWAIINGEKETGITTFFLRHEIDTGAVIRQRRIPIGPDDDAGTIHDRLMMLGGQMVIETVEGIKAGTIHPVEQDDIPSSTELRPAPKIFRDTCHIAWQGLTTQSAHNFVRGLSPYPAAWTTLCAGSQQHDIKIYKASPADTDGASPLPPGSIVTDGKTYLNVRTTDGFLSLQEVQIAGKRRMPIEDFLRGFKCKNGMKMS